MGTLIKTIIYVCLLLSCVKGNGQTLSYVDDEVTLRKTWITIGYDTIRMVPNYAVEKLTKNEASRKIDQILSVYGRIRQTQ